MDNVTIIRVIAGLLFVGVLIIVAIIPYWMIFKKAGFSPWLSILMAIPLVNIIVLYVVALSEWKVVPRSQTVSYPPFPPRT